MRAGDVLVLSNGELVTVEWVQHEILESPIKVYNFEVQDFHTYFVGECGVLVHNDCIPEDIYAFGNASNPRGGRADKDFNASSGSEKVGGNPNYGASTFTSPEYAPLSGYYYKIPKGTELPNGLGFNPDGADIITGSQRGYGHRTIYPTEEMSVDSFNELFQSLPWQKIGKKASKK